MTPYVKRYIRNCRRCSRSKASREKYHGALKPLLVPDRRWAHISLDFVVNFPVSRDFRGYEYMNILVVTDRLSKQVYYIAINGMTAEDTARAFYDYV